MPSSHPRNPYLTVDIIIEFENRIVLIQRKNPPHGWALPGGFVEYGESVETAAIREAKEETNLDITLLSQFHVYSAPNRDPRFHTASCVFLASVIDISPLQALDDAQNIGLFSIDEHPPLVFDHEQILSDYQKFKQGLSPLKIFSFS